MIMPKQQMNEMVNGILPDLLPAKETTTQMLNIKGFRLIQQGITKDVNGKQIHPGTDYLTEQAVTVDVNHERRMRQIILESKNMEEVNERLSDYLVKFGRDFQK